MKKNYFFTLLLMLVATISFGQNLLTNGDLESWDDDTTPTGWTKSESLTKSTESHGGSFSALRNGGSKTKDLAQKVTGIVPGASYTISFWYKASGDDSDARIWSLWKNGSNNVYHAEAPEDDPLRGPNNGYLSNNGGVWSQHSVTVTAPANVDALFFEVRSYSNSVVYWDDLSVVKNGEAVPYLSITSPVDGTSVASSDVNVSLSVQDFTVGNTQSDDGYIKYTVDNGTPVDKYDTNDIALTGLSQGEHTVEVELVKPDGSSLDTEVKESVTFTVSSYAEVANIGALRSGTEGEFYKLTGEVIMTYAQSFRNQKYIQDTTGAILIDDTAGAITTSYNQYDGITGIMGKLSSYNGIMQFIPSEDPGVATSTSNTLTPEVVTLADYVANPADYQSELIKVEGVSFTDAGETFENGTDYEITSGGTTSNFRTNFYNVDYIGTTIPAVADLTVIASERDGTPNLAAINMAGIALSKVKNQIEGFGLYPNPVTGSTFALKTASANAKNIAIFNVLGKQVVNKNVKGNNVSINIAGLTTGIYIIKVTENGKIATNKLAIK